MITELDSVKTTGKATQSYETIVEVCCHRVALRYWDFEHELTDELIEVLANEGEERAELHRGGLPERATLLLLPR